MRSQPQRDMIRIPCAPEGLQKVRTETGALDFTRLVQKMNYRRKREKWKMRLNPLDTGYRADTAL